MLAVSVLCTSAFTIKVDTHFMSLFVNSKGDLLCMIKIDDNYYIIFKL